MPRSLGANPALTSRTGSAALWPRLLVGLALLVGLVLVGREAAALVPRFSLWVAGLGIWGPIVFIVGYAAAVVAFVPGSLLTLAAGAIFGFTEGVIYVFLAATLGASLAFGLARSVARRSIEQRLAGNARFAAIDRAVGQAGLRIVVLLRLSPVFPFNLLNYALGLTQVRFRDYLVASLGMLPGTIAYVYYGRVAGSVASAASGAVDTGGVGAWTLRLVGVAAAIAVTAVVTRVARRALAEATDG